MTARRQTGSPENLALNGLILSCVLVELSLTGADMGLWGSRAWRAEAYDLAAFQPWLLQFAPGSFTGQAFVMFLSYAFLHGGLIHLVGNMLSLQSLGRVVVRRMGTFAFLVIYAGSAVIGAVFYGLLAPQAGPMIGASGAIFGLAGALAPRQPRAFWRLVAGLIILNLALWALTGGLLAWQAHLGGFLAGLALVRSGWIQKR